MINMPTTDIFKLITGEVDMPANIEHGESTDVSFMSIIADKDTGADTPNDKLAPLLDTETLRNDPIADPVLNKVIFSPVLNVSGPVLPSRDARFSDVNQYSVLPITSSTKDVHNSDLTVVTMTPTAKHGNDPAIGYASPVPSIDIKGRVPAQYKSTTQGSPQMPIAAGSPQAPLQTSLPPHSGPNMPLPDVLMTRPKYLQKGVAIAMQAEALMPTAQFPMRPAVSVIGQETPVDTSMQDAPLPVKPEYILPAPMAAQTQTGPINPPSDRQLQPPATGAGETVKPRKNIPAPTWGTGSIAPQRPAADQPVSRNDFTVPVRAPSTQDKTIALQSDIVSSRSTPFPRQQNLQNGTEKTGAQIGQFNMNLQKEPEISTKPAMLARPQSAVQDAPVQAARTQFQHNDATPMQHPAPLQSPTQPIVLTPPPPLRHTSEDQIVQSRIKPMTGVETRMRGQKDNAHNVQPTQATTLAPMVDATPIETIDPVLTPDAVPLETRGADITTLTRVDTPLSRPEVMRHVAQQLTDVARQMPDRPVELALNPEELGRVRLTFTTTDAGLHVAVIAERGETMDLLRRHIESLAQDFRELGYRDVKFDFSGNGARDDANASGNENTDQDQTANPDAVSQDVDAPIQLSLEPSTGLDLRL